MKLSVVIPAKNESESISKTVKEIFDVLSLRSIEHEIIVVDDGSTDDTYSVLQDLAKVVPSLVVFRNDGLNGFGRAVIYGLERFSGDCVAIMMADGSDSPYDLVRFFDVMNEKQCDAVFGSRFIKGGSFEDYPPLKLLLNRILNTVLRVLFHFPYNDFTNAFKLYSRETILGLKPILAQHFNLTVELPLKTIIRGFSFAIVPNSWKGRRHGISKLKFKESGSKYLFTIFYCLAEKYLSGSDYKKNNV